MYPKSYQFIFLCWNMLSPSLSLILRYRDNKANSLDLRSWPLWPLTLKPVTPKSNQTVFLHWWLLTIIKFEVHHLSGSSNIGLTRKRDWRTNGRTTLKYNASGTTFSGRTEAKQNSRKKLVLTWNLSLLLLLSFLRIPPPWLAFWTGRIVAQFLSTGCSFAASQALRRVWRHLCLAAGHSGSVSGSLVFSLQSGLVLPAWKHE